MLSAYGLSLFTVGWPQIKMEVCLRPTKLPVSLPTKISQGRLSASLPCLISSQSTNLIPGHCVTKEGACSRKWGGWAEWLL